MDIEVVIHGVPSGQDYYGIKEEWANVELFYDGSTEPVKFVVETKKQGGKAYTYYTYLRYGLMGSGGRSGSYFGLTLRFDQYYSDALHIYNLLDIIFKRHIVGTVLTSVGDTYRYTIGSFSQKATEVNQAQQALIQLVLTTCIPVRLMNMDDSFIHPITVAPTANIADVSEAAMLASIKKYSKVILSPDYETNIEKEYKKKLQEAEGKGGNIVAQKDKTIAEKESVISSLNTTIATQQNQIAVLEQEVKRKETEIKQQKQNGDLTQLVVKIKEPITALADYFRIKDSKPPTSKYGRKNFRLGIVSCALSTIVLAICIYSLFRTPGSTNDDKELTNLQTQVSTLNQDKKQLTNIIKLKNDTISDLRTTLSTNTPKTTPPKTTLRIDVKGYSTGKLSISQIYTITVKNGASNYSGKGTWTITNAEIISGKDTDSQITIQPNGNGNVKLAYIADDSNCTCNSRTFQIEKPAPAVTENITFEIKIEPDVTEVEFENEYTFSISGYTGNGTWKLDGFSQPADKNASTITVKAIDTGKGNTEATISYTPDGGKKEKKSFKYINAK